MTRDRDAEKKGLRNVAACIHQAHAIVRERGTSPDRLTLNLTAKKVTSRSPRHTFEVYFRDTLEKDTFMVRLKSIRERLTPRGQTQLS